MRIRGFFFLVLLGLAAPALAKTVEVNLPDKTVTVNVNETAVKDAIKSVMDSAGVKFDIAKGAGGDTKVTVELKGVKLKAALDVLVEEAGWTYTVDDKGVVHFKKKTVAQ